MKVYSKTAYYVAEKRKAWEIVPEIKNIAGIDRRVLTCYFDDNTVKTIFYGYSCIVPVTESDPRNGAVEKGFYFTTHYYDDGNRQGRADKILSRHMQEGHKIYMGNELFSKMITVFARCAN